MILPNKAESGVVNLASTAEKLPADVLKLKSDRLADLGDYAGTSGAVPVFFAAICGTPGGNNPDAEAVFRNELFTLRDNLIKSPKFLIYMENILRAPTPDELSVFSGVSREDRVLTLDNLCALIKINGDTFREGLAKKALFEATEKTPDDGVYDLGVKILVWLARCTKSSAYASAASEIPALIYWGNIAADDVTFLCFMNKIGIDVIYLSENKSSLGLIKNGTGGVMQVFELPESAAVTAYPDKLLKVKVATQSYIAERQLDTFLYGGDTIFRDFQFSKMRALTLKTTYDEIDIMWHEPAKFRSGFSAADGRVNIPNIFAKISGIPNGDTDEYWNDVRYKLSPFSRYIINAPTYKRQADAYTLRIFAPYQSGEKILIDKLKRSPLNKYGYLSDELQNTIFEKFQEAADSGFLKLDFSELIPQILYVGLALDKEILRLLQKFDYTKDIPKIVIIDAIEDTFSKTECIQLVLYNLLGFDILIYTPTGYRNLETFISDTAFELYTFSEFKYNTSVPRFKIPDKIPTKDEGGFFDRLFRKRK
ncbi:MAG: YceG family protein [Ruminococcus sp.]|jgi:hypothetical protein|nr:YceG family protein [Ruminococcus sp.]